MFNTLDSQPQEWLFNDPGRLHTVSICRFRDAANAKRWIDLLVPKNKNGQLLKWSAGARQRRNKARRSQFIENLNQRYDELDFSVHCISSTEGEISLFTQYLYLQNLERMSQEHDDKGRNNLVFKLSETRSLKLPVLRAARLVWIYFVLNYMREVEQLEGSIYSDWFSCDATSGEQRAGGVAFVNFLLQSTGSSLQLSISQVPSKSEADLLSDWFAGWCNTSKSGTGDPEFTSRFDQITEREPNKISWVEFKCDLQVSADGGPPLPWAQHMETAKGRSV